MPLQFSETLRNNRINQFETTIGSSAKLRIMAGAMPANCAAADAGTLLCEIALPSDWLTAAAVGVKTKNGTWSGTADVAAGVGTTATYFRIKNSTGTTTHCQGSISAVGGGGNMTIDNSTVISGQPVNVATFSIAEGNA
jgi:hypothetical protein